jgi:hypothetical protein
MQQSKIALMVRKIKRIPHEHYLMHGSQRMSRVLVPKKPQPTSSNIRHRRRAVYATALIPVAVLYALAIHDLQWQFKSYKTVSVVAPKDGFESYRHGFIHIVK